MSAHRHESDFGNTSSDSVAAQGGGCAALGDLILAVEALGINAEQHLDAVAGPHCHLGRGYSPVEPGGQACMAVMENSP